MPGSKVLEPGLFTTVQDGGRWGYQQDGLRVQGVMDPYAYGMANLLVDNPPGAAVLEVTMVGPRLRAQQDMVIAVTGADLSPSVDGRSIPMWQTVFVQTGSIIAFGTQRSGCRAYLAVAGGWDVPVVLGSRSTCVVSRIGGVDGRPLRAGDELPVGRPDKPLASLYGLEIVAQARPCYQDPITLRVVLGPQQEAFTEAAMATLLCATYTVTRDADRMGYRLEGPPLKHVSSADIYSEGIAWGAMQVPPNGQPIILLAGRQGVGGYAKIATISTVDLPLIAQAKPGDRLRFQAVTVAAAQAALAEQNRWLGPAGIRRVPLGTPGAVLELLRTAEAFGLGMVSVSDGACQVRFYREQE